MWSGRFYLSFVLMVTLGSLAGCSMLQKKVNSEEELSTDSGFSFRFAMSGDWYPGSSQTGMYMVGQKPQPDGTSKLAIVRYGPIRTHGGKSLTNKEMLEVFKRDIEQGAQGGRVSKVKSNFTQKKLNGADCLFFEQSGEDSTSNGPMNMSNDGLVCLHPRRQYQFIWMAISERWPLGQTPNANFSEDKNQFFNSLKFID